MDSRYDGSSKKNGRATQEDSMAGRCRSDQMWIKKYGSGVYVEHENRYDAKIDGEIQKLCNDVSKLKVLITYVGDKNFNVGELTERIRTAMRNYRATFTGELLLIIAGEHEHEWEAISRHYGWNLSKRAYTHEHSS